MRPLAWLVRRAALVVVLAVAVAALDGCTSSVDDSDTGEDPTPAAESPPAVRLHVVSRVTRVAGDLPRKDQQRIARVTKEIVADYVRSAFVDKEARPAFTGFTPGARRIATRNRAVLTLGGSGEAEVQPKRVRAFLAVLAPHRRIVGATARLEVDLTVTDPDGSSHPVRIGGRLLLTPTPDGIEVFGFDLQRSGGGAS